MCFGNVLVTCLTTAYSYDDMARVPGSSVQHKHLTKITLPKFGVHFYFRGCTGGERCRTESHLD